MSQSVSDPKITAPVADSPSSDDIFKNLSDGDELDSLDLTTPIRKTEKKENDKSAGDKKEADESEQKSEEETEEVEEETEEDELSDLEEELEEPDEEKLELDASPIRRREILAKYPNLFKEFPGIEKSIYREREFTKILPTIEDAKKAVEQSQMLEGFADDMVAKGNVKNVLKMIKDANPDTFAEVADNYLEHLAVVDEGAYHHVIGNVIKNAVITMVQEAKASGDDDYRIAAGLLYKHVFGSTKFVPPQKLAKETKEKGKDDQLTEREKEFTNRQIEMATNEIDTRVKNTIRAAIENNIDPKNSMTPYVKKTAVKDALDKVTELISKDSRFNKLNERLWENMIKDNFSKESQDKVKKAYLARAKSLLMPVLKSIRNEALRGMGKRVKDDVIEDNDKNEKPERQKTERRLSSDKSKANLDSLKGKSSYEALNELMGDA